MTRCIRDLHILFLVSLDRGNSMGDEQLPIGVFGTVICGICVALEMRIIRVLRTILRVKF